MLSFRHAFQAGNHGDVLKYLVLVQLLDYLTARPKPLWFVDTHAGAGVYDLEREFATRLAEYTTGISRLWEETELATALERYVSLVRRLNPERAPQPLSRFAMARTMLTRADDRSGWTSCIPLTSPRSIRTSVIKVGALLAAVHGLL